MHSGVLPQGRGWVGGKALFPPGLWTVHWLWGGGAMNVLCLDVCSRFEKIPVLKNRLSYKTHPYYRDILNNVYEYVTVVLQ